MKHSWKTTLGGVMATIGTVLKDVELPGDYWPVIANILVAVGLFLMGVSARDSNVTSEESGAK
jgi:hypothetical protein